jgi:hypothetical protein
MIKNSLLIVFCLMSIAICSFVFAADSEVTLDTNDTSSGFAVKDSDGNSVFRAGGDGNVELGGTAGVDGIKFPDGTLQTTAAESGTIVQVVTKVISTNLGPGANNAYSGNLETMSITPKYANSMILVSMHGVISVAANGGSDPHLSAYVRIVAGTTPVATTNASFNNQRLTRAVPFYIEGQYLPGATSPVTFGIQLHQRRNTLATIYVVDPNMTGTLIKAVEVAQ